MQENNSMKKKFFFFLKLAVGAGLVILLVRHVDWRMIEGELRDASIPLIFLALLLYVAGMLLSVERWRATAHYKGFALSFRHALSFHMAGLFLNNFLPSFLGGDAYRSYLLGRTGKRYAAAVSTIVLTRFVGLWAVIALFLFFGLLGFSSIFSQWIFQVFGLGLGLFLLFDIALTFFSGHAPVRKFFSIFPKKLQHFFHEIGGYSDTKFLSRSFFASVIFSFVGVGLFNFALFSALGESVPIAPYLAVIFLVSVISSIPVSVNNIGLKEWAYYTFFPLIGMSPEAALAVALLGRFLQMGVSLFGAPFFFKNRLRNQEAENEI